MTLLRFSKLLLILSIGFVAPIHAKEYIAKIKGAKSALTRSIPSLRSIDGVYIKDTNPHGNLVKISIDASSPKASALKLGTLIQRSDIEYVVENSKVYAYENPDDTRFSEQWALEKIRAVGAWSLTTGSKNVVVAVIDTGVDVKHEDLAGNIWVNAKEVAGNGKDDDNNGFVDDVTGWDFHQNDNAPNDETSASGNPGHGTHCSGIVGAIGNNGKGLSGISQKVSIMPIRFLGADGGGDLFNSIKAIDYAVANGANVISASWGAGIPRSSAEPIIEAIERANQKNILFVAAAGNDGKSNDSTPSYPANAGTDNTINVAASDASDKKPYWSNYGKRTVDLAAPGADILSTLPGNKYGKLSGTSMATPLVAGLAALLKSQSPDLSVKQLKAILQSTGAKVDIESACDCRIDAEASTRAVADKKLTVVPNAASLEVGKTLDFSAWGGVGAYTYKSSDPDVASITAEGKLTAIKEGDVNVTVTDAQGAQASSLAIRVGQAGSGDVGGGDCPFGEPMICAIICSIMPEAPWCEGAGGGDEGDDEGDESGWPFGGMSLR